MGQGGGRRWLGSAVAVVLEDVAAAPGGKPRNKRVVAKCYGMATGYGGAAMTVKPKAPARRAKAVPGQPTRIAPDVFAAAQQAAARESRSAAEQVNHWARVGQSVALHQSASRRRIEAVLAGSLPMSVLRPDEREIVNAELDAAITAKAQSTPLGAAVSTDGVTTVALDDEGRLVEYRPDGTSRVLDPTPVDGAIRA